MHTATVGVASESDGGARLKTQCTEMTRTVMDTVKRREQWMKRVNPILVLWMVSVDGEKKKMKTWVCWRALNSFATDVYWISDMMCVFIPPNSFGTALLIAKWINKSKRYQQCCLSFSERLNLPFYFWLLIRLVGKGNVLSWQWSHTTDKIDLDVIEMANRSGVRSFFNLKMPFQTCTRNLRVSAWELVWAKRSLWTTRGMLCSESAHSSAYFVQHHYQLGSLYKLSNSFAHSLLAAAARPAVLPPAASCAFTPRHLPAGTVYLWFPRGLLLISRCSCYGWLKKREGLKLCLVSE